MTAQLEYIQQELQKIVGFELAELIDMAKKTNQGKYLIELPEPSDSIDTTLEEASSLVARTSNVYGRISRLSGIARAEYKLRKGDFDRKYKKNRATGKNEAERDAYAMQACEDEHTAMVIAEALAELAESFEHGARVASESARKILDKIQNIKIASVREESGGFSR